MLARVSRYGQPRTILQCLIPLGSLIPTHREIAIDHADTIIYDFILLRKIVASGIFNYRAAAVQFCELSDEPRQSILIGRLITNGHIHFNANSWSEARQGASSSIQRYSSIFA